MKLNPFRYKKIHFNSIQESQRVSIVGDAAVATSSTGNGRLIPLVILDTRQRQDLIEVMQVHANFSEGDVVISWGSTKSRPHHVILFLRFQRPTERAAMIEFDIERQGVLVEHVLITQALYIQAGKPGDRFLDGLDAPRLLVEVPDTGFRPTWDKVYRDSIVKRLRKQGLSRRAANSAYATLIDSIRDVAQFRMK